LFFADVIFFIFLYQRWIYRVDPSRVNEYGFSKEMLDKKGKSLVANGEEVSLQAADVNVASEEAVLAEPSTRQRKSRASRVRKEE
jgi:hypothetical protein